MKTKDILIILAAAVAGWAIIASHTNYLDSGDSFGTQSATEDQIKSVQPRHVFQKQEDKAREPQIRSNKPEKFDGWEWVREEDLWEVNDLLKEEQKSVNPVYVFSRLNKDRPQSERTARNDDTMDNDTMWRSDVSTIRGKEANDNNYIQNDAQKNWSTWSSWVAWTKIVQPAWTLLASHLKDLWSQSFSTTSTKDFLEAMYKKLETYSTTKQQNMLIVMLEKVLSSNYDRLKSAWVNVDEVTVNMIDALWVLWVSVDMQVKRDQKTTTSWNGGKASTFKMEVIEWWVRSGQEWTTRSPTPTPATTREPEKPQVEQEAKQEEKKEEVKEEVKEDVKTDSDTETDSDTTNTSNTASTSNLPSNIQQAEQEKENLSQWSELIYVATWKTIEWVTFTAWATWTATNKLISRKSNIYAEFSWLPDLPANLFYEGRVVRENPSDVMSTWELQFSNGKRTNSFTSRWNLSDYSQYVLTIEKKDGNEDPGEHIFEGKF